jgi:hypothetical protein
MSVKAGQAHCGQIRSSDGQRRCMAAASLVCGRPWPGWPIECRRRPIGRGFVSLSSEGSRSPRWRQILVPDAPAQLAAATAWFRLRHLTGAVPPLGERPVDGYRPAPALVASRDGGRGRATDVPWKTPVTYSLPEGKRSGNVILTAGDQALSDSAGHLPRRAWVLS